jgi:hypothetical protein
MTVVLQTQVSVMKGRKLIEGAGHAPEQLKIICEAFDDAWAVIAPRITGYVTVRQAARLELANAVLSLASEGLSEAACRCCASRDVNAANRAEILSR